MTVNIPGVISVVIFYIIILAVGIWAGRKKKSDNNELETEEVMLAGRNIGIFVGIFTMTGNNMNMITSRSSMKYEPVNTVSISNRFRFNLPSLM